MFIITLSLFLHTDTYVLRNCNVTSPSIGTIKVSCDSSHQILVTVLCADLCTKYLATSNGYSPLTVRGLDPGEKYSVTISVFDGNQAVLSDERVIKIIRVRSTISSKINDYASVASSLNTCTVARLTLFEQPNTKLPCAFGFKLLCILNFH